MIRWILFLISILVGISVGLLFGWRIIPVEPKNTSPESLRVDYKTDYVLMVGEIFQSENDIEKAVERLSLLGATDLENLVLRTILFAEKNQYTKPDIEILRSLLQAIESVLSITQMADL